MANPDAIIIGAGPAGLASAASLQAQGVSAVILEKADTLGSAWRLGSLRSAPSAHRKFSFGGRPGLPMPSAYGRYASRAQFVEYLERYAARFDLKPEYNAHVLARSRGKRRDGASKPARSLISPPSSSSPLDGRIFRIRRPGPASKPSGSLPLCIERLPQSRALRGQARARGRLRQFRRRDRARPRGVEDRRNAGGARAGQDIATRPLGPADPDLGDRPAASARPRVADALNAPVLRIAVDRSSASA